ncbi:MAG: hypothetical protein Q7U75_20080, partial [Desulfobacterales bacterium]|nr:hypothetical protein [Desulfobacterales bacterium]
MAPSTRGALGQRLLDMSRRQQVRQPDDSPVTGVANNPGTVVKEAPQVIPVRVTVGVPEATPPAPVIPRDPIEKWVERLTGNQVVQLLDVATSRVV